MAITVKVGHAKTHLSQLLAQVEGGEEVIIARGERPVARLTKVVDAADERAAVEELLQARATFKKVTREEIRAWINEGRR